MDEGGEVWAGVAQAERPRRWGRAWVLTSPAVFVKGGRGGGGACPGREPTQRRFHLPPDLPPRFPTERRCGGCPEAASRAAGGEGGSASGLLTETSRGRDQGWTWTRGAGRAVGRLQDPDALLEQLSSALYYLTHTRPEYQSPSLHRFNPDCPTGLSRERVGTEIVPLPAFGEDSEKEAGRGWLEKKSLPRLDPPSLVGQRKLHHFKGRREEEGRERKERQEGRREGRKGKRLSSSTVRHMGTPAPSVSPCDLRQVSLLTRAFTFSFLRKEILGPGRYQPAGIRRSRGAECGKHRETPGTWQTRYSAYSLQTAQKPLLLTPPTRPRGPLLFLPPPPTVTTILPSLRDPCPHPWQPELPHLTLHPCAPGVPHRAV